MEGSKLGMGGKYGPFLGGECVLYVFFEIRQKRGWMGWDEMYVLYAGELRLRDSFLCF